MLIGRKQLARKGCSWAVCKEDADRHQTKVASHTAAPHGGCEMAGARVAPIISACPWVGDMVSPCPLPTARLRVWGVAFPAISRCLKARLYGWLPLSNAYGISSGATQHKSNGLTSFHSVTTQYIIKQLRHFLLQNVALT